MRGLLQEELGIWRLTPYGNKGISERLEVVHPGQGNSAECRIFTKGDIAHHHGGVAERLVEGIRIVNGAV
jgi:hypothetical protein